MSYSESIESSRLEFLAHFEFDVVHRDDGGAMN